MTSGQVWRIAVAAVTMASAVAPASAMEARARVDHHLRKAADLVEHFDALLTTECPRLAGAAAWDTYVDGETEQLVLLLAHLEQAWVEAKKTPDDDIRRSAKAPRRQKDQARQLVDKLSTCAAANGATFSPLLVWRRVERELPQRQAEIALPE